MAERQERVRKFAAVERAYARLEIKAAAGDDGLMTITGVATTPTPDRMGDIVVPTGAKFALPMPLLYQHNADMPIGTVDSLKVAKDGIDFVARIAKASVAPFIAEARSLLDAGLIRAVSIGFRPLEMEPIDAKDPWGAARFLEWEMLELSVVTIPANRDATIETIKSLDVRAPASVGEKRAPIKLLRRYPDDSGSTSAHHAGAIKLIRTR
jgi:HK97 family phage prohead protease